jgi:CRISPR-associated protein Cas1
MKQPIYLFSGGRLSRRQNTLVLQGGEGKKYIPVERISEIQVFGEVDFNKRLLEFLTQKGILLHFYNYHGYYVGSFYPREHYNSGFLVLKQAENYLNADMRMDLARRFVRGAIGNIKQVLQYYLNRGFALEESIQEIEALVPSLEDQTSPEALMAIEGNVREVYYGAFDTILKTEALSFNRRTRRPPQNRLNALISFGNSLCYVVALSEIYRTHLDPRIGFLHTTNFRRFTLNLDVSEVFKPVLVDRLIFSLANRGQIQKAHFTESAKGVFLTEKGRRLFVEEWEKRLGTTIRHPGLKRNVSYRRLIRLELYKIEKHLIGEKVYTPFKARW